LLIGQSVDNGTSQETKQTRDDVIQFSFAGPGDTGSWSETGQGHPYPEYETANEIANDVCRRYIRKSD